MARRWNTTCCRSCCRLEIRPTIVSWPSTEMKILSILRPENLTLVKELVLRGHDVWMPREAAVFVCQFNLPIQPLDWSETSVTLPAPLEHGRNIPAVIDTVLVLHEVEY